MELTPQKLKIFFAKNADLLRRLAERRDTTLGFNAFALVSDTYYRENFHSDIIRAILDPNEAHGEGTAFLRLFVHFLRDIASHKEKNGGKLSETLRSLEITKDTEVIREEGRVDVKIKAPDWTIIVENKINGASDMYRQIPKYIEECKKAGEEVVAVVYITAAQPKYPARNGWKDGDDAIVEPILLPVVGFTEDRSIPNLAEGWIERCELISKGFNTKSILNQYAELLRNHAGETMDTNDIKEMLKSMSSNNIPYSQLRTVLDKVPATLVDCIYAKFSEETDVLEEVLKIPTWGGGVKLRLKPINVNKPTTSLTMEIWCIPEYLTKIGISVYADSTKKSKSIVGFLKKFDSTFAFSEQEGTVISPLNPDDVYGDIDSFLKRLEDLIQYLDKNKAKIEECFKNAK